MKMKYILIIVVVIIIGLVVVACVIHKHKKDHYIETQEKRINLYFKHNLNSYHGLKITKFQKGPMGSYSAKGYINNNKKYEFQAFIGLGDDKNQFNGDFEYNQEKIGELLKEKDAKDRLTVDEIIEKEHLDKNEYEAEPPLFFFSGRLE
ncbi:TPA: DUF1433 domain-containing protein [Staphylococcus aureus]|uniref:DUF1433 domain-containing protein n=1 Tax=Staphylococcus aureus TaxID=1280 RepID=UPI001624CAEF|nr:DUF1433 domain-containing protein [Staphylococcus aureus]MCJ8111195.1 DUF1433 domain-containing protein [Staphylococcus aureus]HBC4296594.1 DUF1433 domain-containing protein [Staphylococcus aureus]HCV3557575.1 DUF1433 domain-containing protein [Staphylococcus aureus]HCV3708778.1 DUF1433 domain-containing protein [Staphylococcus aureus]HCZ5728344.1 DUF1433 domain-containing protein [Staphylococcus aureus]